MRIEQSLARPIPGPASKATPQSPFRSHLPSRSPPRLSPAEAQALLSDAWTKVIGNIPDPRTSALLTAHWALETDAGRCMPGNNFAGIKAAPGAAGKSFSTVEGHGAARREVEARFRTYESAEAGAQDYVKLLATRYPDAVTAAQAGDSRDFGRALAHGGYFTADPASYAAGLEWRLATLDSGIFGHAVASSLPRSSLAQASLEGVLGALRRRPDDG
ncbi:MAG TPA: glucosaminidase domain-containing protein [Polyangiaceae bacterium]|nr:glucosaminidase domain-containing protein [Polyangiaceae bacterium]